MNIGETRTKTETRVEHVDTLCDLCGKSTELGGHYDRTEVTVECRVGDVYPEGDDDRTAHWTDACRVCFLERIVPAIEALGVTFRKRLAYRRHDFDTVDGKAT